MSIYIQKGLTNSEIKSKNITEISIFFTHKKKPINYQNPFQGLSNQKPRIPRLIQLKATAKQSQQLNQINQAKK